MGDGDERGEDQRRADIVYETTTLGPGLLLMMSPLRLVRRGGSGNGAEPEPEGRRWSASSQLLTRCS